MPLSSRFVVQFSILLLAVGFLALIGIVGMTIWLNERAQGHFLAVIEARDTRSSAVELRTALQTAESSQRGFLLTGNEIYLAPYDSAKAAAQREINVLKRNLAPYSDAEAMLQRLSAVVGDKIDEMDQTIRLKADRRNDEVRVVVDTNRGKALMDEANLFLSGIVRATEERLTKGVVEQSADAATLRWVSIVGGIVIVLVVGVTTITVARYTRDVRQARDEVRALNAGLEERVTARTSDLAKSRDHAEVLLAEVNHRVANSLAMVASLVKMQANALADRAAREVLDVTHARIFAIASVHRHLYGSNDVRFVALGDYLPILLDQLATSMHNEGHGAWLKYDIEPLQLRTDASVNLGVVVTEWVTNAFKYAYPESSGEVRVKLARLSDGAAELLVEDDGVGRRQGSPIRGTGLGSRLVSAMAGTMRAEIEYLVREPGTTARLVFPLAAG